MSKKKKDLDTLIQEAIVRVEDQPTSLPENWIWSKLDYLTDSVPYSLVDGPFGSNLKTVDYKTEGVRLIQLQNIGDGYWKDQNQKFISEEKAKELERCITYPDDIVIAKMAAPIARATIVPKIEEKYIVVADCIKLTSDKKLNIKYLVHCINSPIVRQVAESLGKGSTRKRINLKDVKKLPIPLPPLHEQKRIAEKVERLLNKIEEAKQLIEEAKETFELRRAAILDKAFRGELTKKYREKTSNGQLSNELLEKIRNKKEKIYLELVDEANKEGSKNPQRPKKFDNKINQENFISLPKNWDYCMLGDIIYDFKYGTSNKSDYNFKGTPVIRIPNIGEEFINTHDLKYLQESNGDFNSLVKEGDLLIVRSNGSKRLVGKCSIVQKGEEKYAFASYLIRLRPVLVIPEYILWLLKSDRVKEQFFSKSKSSAGINNINTEELATTIIPLPPIEEQREIVDKIKALLTKEEESKNILALDNYVDNLKTSILSKAFRGELGTNDPNEENSIELLKEILQKQVK